MKLSLVHVCFNQHLSEKKPKRCNCRKRISLTEATQQVEKGFAQWLILNEYTTIGSEICPICQNGDTKKNCQHCKTTGEVEKAYPVRVLGTDIVEVTAGCLDEENRIVYRSVKAKKTPRVATIEKAHIYRAFVDLDKEEQERIEAYGLMILESRIEMGIGVEPPNDLKNGTGRLYDYGRSPFARIADERTSLGAGKVGARICEGYVQNDES
jgi:hypothetical protein